ncbi:hypothetical protein TeGR_g1837 [Tetraparma gracilis]|uniref:G-patch domain-containing protein n=1 Tax=Tetraparma gracilis TaxID=2962635 RepID=A0ABQ6MXD6_9STRA|nr:hypothetical protein TeGR_g1837 [Tetraparma gracilis]
MPKPAPFVPGQSSSLPTPGSFAYKQMIKMGWKPDEGLGKDGEGIKTFVKVVKQQDGVGIGGGGNGGQIGWRDAGNDGAGLSTVLSKLKGYSATDGMSQEEQKAKRKRDRKIEKRARKEAEKKKAAAASAEASPNNSPAPPGGNRSGTHHGKWIKAKDLTTKSAADLACIFGAGGGGSAWGSVKAVSSSSDGPQAAPKKEKKEKKKRRAEEGGEEEVKEKKAKKEKKDKKSKKD